MTRTRHILSATVLALAMHGLSAAEEAIAIPLEERLRALEAELGRLREESAQKLDIQGLTTELENFKYQVQRNDETKRALSTRNLLIGGVIQARAAYASHDVSSPPAPSNLAATAVNNPANIHKRNLTFDVPTVLLNFNGSLYRDYESGRNLTYRASVAGSPTTGTNASFLTVLDASLTYQFLPTLENDGDRLGLTFGQQLLPFGLEANTTEELKPVINNAQFVSRLGLGARQVGLILSGEAFANFDFGYNYRQALVAYSLGVVNGTGPNLDDNNNYKDQIARVAITVPADYDSWLRELRFGVSAYNGRRALFDATNAYRDSGKQTRLGFDIYYNHWPLGFTYEFIRGRDETLVAGAVTSADSVSHTATVFYSFGEQFLRSIKTQGKYDDWWPTTFQPFVRYDQFDPDTDNGNDTTAIYTVGLNIFFAETTKAQINVNRRVQQQGALDDQESHEVLAQLQFGF